MEVALFIIRFLWLLKVLKYEQCRLVHMVTKYDRLGTHIFIFARELTFAVI